MNEEQRDEVVRYWWSKAEESLASAQREIAAGSYVFAMNRVYYAAFYAVSAALLEREFQFAKHTGVRATFHREFIKTGLLDIRWGKLYDQFFEDRQEGDYIALVCFEPEYVETQLEQCIQFLAALRPLIIALGHA
jgi:uncharacterized protein (UPF0332 family)